MKPRRCILCNAPVILMGVVVFDDRPAFRYLPHVCTGNECSVYLDGSPQDANAAGKERELPPAADQNTYQRGVRL